MRYTTTVGKIALMVLAMFATSTWTTAGAQTTTDKIEQKAEGTKDKAKGITDEATGKAKSVTENAKTSVSDSWLTAKTKIALFADKRVKGRQISVATKRGAVTLLGKVDSPESRSAASEIARGIQGVKDVKNDLQVVPSANAKAVAKDDKAIAKSVKTRLTRDPQLKGAKIRARADAGVVTLTGEVPNITVSARASEVAREVSGVRSVNNELTSRSRS